jgi:hypothetical protein
MERFLIEVPHEAEPEACIRAVKAFLNTGSHFLSNADWGCYDGDHKAWMILELDSKKEALSVIPGEYNHETNRVDNKVPRTESS